VIPNLGTSGTVQFDNKILVRPDGVQWKKSPGIWSALES
jgi:hypothetical protein